VGRIGGRQWNQFGRSTVEAAYGPGDIRVQHEPLD
jgi:hypothetical protein